MSYKAGIADLREAPALKIIRLLTDQGASIAYHDDYVRELSEFGLTSQPLDDVLDHCDVAASSPSTRASTSTGSSTAPRWSWTFAAPPPA